MAMELIHVVQHQKSTESSQMTQSIDIRWVIGTDFAEMHGGSQDKACQEQIGDILHSICRHGGSLGMTIDPPQEIGPECLDIRSENGLWIVNLCENTETDHEVRTYHDPNAIPGEVNVLGDLWDSRMICRDFAIIEEIVRMFFQTGKVGVNLLS